MPERSPSPSSLLMSNVFFGHGYFLYRLLISQNVTDAHLLIFLDDVHVTSLD